MDKTCCVCICLLFILILLFNTKFFNNTKLIILLLLIFGLYVLLNNDNVENFKILGNNKEYNNYDLKNLNYLYSNDNLNNENDDNDDNNENDDNNDENDDNDDNNENDKDTKKNNTSKKALKAKDLLPGYVVNSKDNFDSFTNLFNYDKALELDIAENKLGVDTIGQSKRNASQDLREHPVCPKFNIGPWNNSTIEPDNNIKSLY